jgi:hypothetical protein
MEGESKKITRTRDVIFAWVLLFSCFYLCISFMWLMYGFTGEFPTSEKCLNHNLVPHSPEWIDHILFECGLGGYKYYFNTYLSGYFIWTWRKVLALKRLFY